MKFYSKSEDGRIVLRGHRTVINLANRDEASWCPRRWLFSFGPFGTHVLVWSASVEDGLEVAAAWLADHAPGFLTPHNSAEVSGLIEEECQARGLAWPIPDGADLDPYWDAKSAALTDLTYTESGYLTAYEWTVDEVSRHDLAALLEGT